MRVAIMAAACAVACATAPADAATIIQHDTDESQAGLVKFYDQLGTLNSVTLQLDITKYRDWIVTSPAGATADTVTWSINGLYQVYANRNMFQSFAVPLQGSGITEVDISPLVNAVGGPTNLVLTATNHSVINFDPARFVSSVYQDGFVIIGNDPGYGGAPDTTISAAGGSTVTLNAFTCRNARTGEDFCGQAKFTLTYDYTPSGAVPEPATWALMILGFGAIGYAMRRRRYLIDGPGPANAVQAVAVAAFAGTPVKRQLPSLAL